MIGIRSPTEPNYFSFSSEADPASCTMGTWDPFLGGKARPERGTDHSPHLVLTSRMSRSYTSCPPWRLNVGSGTALL
jgi:hypothetical protein